MDCEKMYEVFDIPYLQGLSGMYLRTMHVLEYFTAIRFVYCRQHSETATIPKGSASKLVRQFNLL